jgi:predicted dehydrogenase
MEAMHYRHHPMAARMTEIVRGGMLGTVHHIDAVFHSPSLLRPGFRKSCELGGGAAMDLGCYPVSLVRMLAAQEPEVTVARARLLSTQVDRAMEAEMVFPDGCKARVSCSMLSVRFWSAKAEIQGDKGTLSVRNPFHPYVYNRLRLRLARGTSFEHVSGGSSYYYQLLAFCNAVCRGGPITTDAGEAAEYLKVVDSIYQAAGLLPRGYPS